MSLPAVYKQQKPPNSTEEAQTKLPLQMQLTEHRFSSASNGQTIPDCFLYSQELFLLLASLTHKFLTYKNNTVN